MRIITRTNGQPFATEASARQQLTAKGLQDTHEVAPREGGYALVPKSAKALKVGDMVRVNGHRARGDNHQFGTTETIRNWHKERTLLEVKGLPASTKVYAGKPGVSGCGLGFHVSELDLVEKDDPITLQPGDYVSTEGMTEEEYHAVARAFMAAGADSGEYPDPEEAEGEPCFGWSAKDGRGMFHGTAIHRRSVATRLIGRHLTIEQVLGATNAGTTTPQPEEATMTTDPITTLKQARQARDEAEKAYQEALEEAREYLGEGFMLAEVGVDWAAPDEDMTDPANWRDGDVLTCIDDGGHGWYTEGKQYAIVRIDVDGWPVMRDDDGDQSALAPSRMKFHHRPT